MKIEYFPLHYRDESGNMVTRESNTIEVFESIKKQAIEWFGAEIGELFDRFANRCEEFSSGRNRAVFIFPKYVVKLPTCGDGCADNDWEGSICGSEPDKIQYARTRLVYHHDIPIVFMERVEYASTKNMRAKLGHEPEWVHSVDCSQVGWTRKGRLVAYDFGMR